MNAEDARKCEKLRSAFEGREAIYIEKGVFRVRVINIRPEISARCISADIQEIVTPGLEFEHSLFRRWWRDPTSPLQWDIIGGFLTTFSENTWAMGYGGWSIFFAPEIVQGVVALASTWTSEMDAMARYRAVCQYLLDHHAYERDERVFRD